MLVRTLSIASASPVPGFDGLAVKNATAIARGAGDRPILLTTIDVLAEMVSRFQEGTMTSDDVGLLLATHRGAAAVRAVAEGRPLGGVAVVQLDRVVRHAEVLGHDLRERRVVALAVRVRAHVLTQGDLPGRAAIDGDRTSDTS